MEAAGELLGAAANRRYLLDGAADEGGRGLASRSGRLFKAAGRAATAEVHLCQAPSETDGAGLAVVAQWISLRLRREVFLSLLELLLLLLFSFLFFLVFLLMLLLPMLLLGRVLPRPAKSYFDPLLYWACLRRATRRPGRLLGVLIVCRNT